MLMGFAEALAAIETAWSLQAAGFRVIAYGRPGSRPALRRVRGVELHEVPAPEQDTTATVAAVRRLIDVVRPAVVLPLDDHAVWVSARLGETGALLAGPAGSAADCALDKGRQLTTAAAAGLPVPATEVLDDLSEVRGSELPVMIKPARALYEIEGRLVRPSGMICANGDELRRAKTRLRHTPVLAQPLIRGVGEGLFGHFGPRGVVGWTAHRRVRMVNPHGAASSACRSHGVDEQLLGPSEQFLETIGWRGLFMLEFLRDADGTPWFMELNGRPWGSMALARRRGFEYPAWAVRGALDASFEPDVPAGPPHILCRNLGLELVHLLFVARGPQSRAPVEWPRVGRAVRDVCRIEPGDRFYNWKRSQPQVFAADTLATLGRYARKLKQGRQ